MRKLTVFFALQFIWLVAPAQEQWFSNDNISGLDPPSGFAARNHAVSFVIGDTAYIGTGDEGSTTIEFWKYVPATHTWTQIANFGGLRRSGAVAFTLGNKGYVGTGKGDGKYYNDFWEYDPVRDTWTEIDSIAGEKRTNAVAFTIGDVAYVGSGKTKTKDHTNDFWKYDPSNDTWTAVDSLPGRGRSEAFAFAANGRGYVGGGRRLGTNVEIDLYSYNPTSDNWEEKGDKHNPYRRESGVAFVLGNQAYIGLGFTKSDFVIYDIANDVVTEASGPEDELGAPNETSRWASTSFVIRNKAFVGLGLTLGSDNTTSNSSDFWSFQSPIPDTPENLTLTTPSQTSVTLRWKSHANNETGYQVERSDNDVADFNKVNGDFTTTGVDVTEYQQIALPVDQEFFYRVRAVNDNHESEFSDTVLINTYTPPSGLTATVASATEITLNWQDNSTGEQGFIIQRTTNGSFSELATVAADVATYTDATAEPGLDYTYRVLAQATKSNSAPSNTVTAGSLTNPTDLAANAMGGTVQLTWTYSGNNAARFILERRITGDDEFTKVTDVTATASPEYQDEAVEEASSYEYRVKAENLPRTSTYSANASVSTPLLDPTSVVATVKDSTVTISWADVSKQETHYVVQRSLGDGSSTVVLDTLVADASSFTDTTSLDAGDYRYAVQAIGASVNSNLVISNTITITVPPKQTEMPGGEEPNDPEEPIPGDEVVTDTDEVIDRDEIKVYPNPSTGQVKVYVGNEQTAYLAVFNSQGRLVEEVQQAEQRSSATVQLDLQHLPVGVYTLRVYTSQGLFVKKIARK